MVPVLVLLTFAALVALDRLVLAKGYFEENGGWPERLESLAAQSASERVPTDVFLQPTFTWSRVGEWGTVCLGVHPMLLRLIGASGEVELRAKGERVRKGEPLVRLWRAGRHLTVRSPIGGRLVRVNRRAGQAPWCEGESGPPWLYRLEPEGVEEERARWLGGAAALEWTRRQYGLLRAYLCEAVSPSQLGAVMADGGDLPVGILAEIDQGVWTGLEDRFLTQAQ
jgi:glycine cleavage system H lipoate-binding protein